MKNTFSTLQSLATASLLLIIVSACSNSGYGELVGVQNRSRVAPSIPYGMVFVPGGAFTMGAGGEDPTYSMVYNPKSVSISAFFMDETEITNNKYRSFVNWVIDSISMRLMAEVDETLVITDDESMDAARPALNYKARAKLKMTPELIEALDPLYLPAEERFYYRKEYDVRKLNYEYYWYDYQAASRKSWDNLDPRTDGVHMSAYVNRPQSLKSRAGFIRKEIVNVYPDTLCWLFDFSYAYNDPVVRSYFDSPQFDHYPVVGVNYHQALAFSQWRSLTYNAAQENIGKPRAEMFRLPTEAEWEYAARGGLDLNPYPWGGPYSMNDKGCFLGNFKPQRGRYSLDGGTIPVIVGHYAPNDYGLYDMMGNVSEWCVDAYQEDYSALHDMNPVFVYHAEDKDGEALKRKVIRGGSFKDFAEYTKTYVRTYEYQDSCKSYIGFRCVMSYLGRDINDSRSSSNVYQY